MQLLSRRIYQEIYLSIYSYIDENLTTKSYGVEDFDRYIEQIIKLDKFVL